MLNVGRIEEGFVLDHIPAGKSMAIIRIIRNDGSIAPNNAANAPANPATFMPIDTAAFAAIIPGTL